MAKQIIGSKIIYLDRVSSTNAFVLKGMKEHSFTEGCLVVAHDQYAGRGMDVNTWESEPGKNLTLSIVLYPGFLPLENQFMLNKVTSLGLYDFANQLPVGDPVKIKWPNDLYIGDRKAAGILINNMILGSSIISTVVGIGFNINQEVFFSGAPNPVSLKNVTGMEFSLNRCLTDLCHYLDKRYRDLRLGDFKRLNDDYLHCQYRSGGYYPFRYKGKRLLARIETVDDIGRLVVRTSVGDEIRCDQKEIAYIIES